MRVVRTVEQKDIWFQTIPVNLGDTSCQNCRAKRHIWFQTIPVNPWWGCKLPKLSSKKTHLVSNYTNKPLVIGHFFHIMQQFRFFVNFCQRHSLPPHPPHPTLPPHTTLLCPRLIHNCLKKWDRKEKMLRYFSDRTNPIDCLF